MKKKFILFILGVLSVGIVGCTSNKQVTQTNIDKTPIKITEPINKEKEEQQEVDEKEKEEKLEKEKQESKIVYAELINEIQTEFSELTVNYIVNLEDGGKTLSINMPLGENKDATIYKCAEIASLKETRFKNEGITNINIYVKNNNESAGMIFFSLANGIYEPTINTL